MKRHTIKWRIFKYNLVVIILLIFMVAIIFNITVRLYMEKDILRQLNKIASHTEFIALQKGPSFLPKHKTPPLPFNGKDTSDVGFYFMLDRSLREPLSVLNANYILLDKDKSIINLTPKDYSDSYDVLSNQIISEINPSNIKTIESYTNFRYDNNAYIAIIKPVSDKNTFGLGWIIIYSSLQKINQLQLQINIILLIILIFSSLVTVYISSLVAKKISSPLSSLNQHVRALSERDFGTKIVMPADDELEEFIHTINIMSEKLHCYDQAQKTFLQNISHEFRTPLMSIQSYAEGMKYHVIDNETAHTIIIDETKRMTKLVEDLLYLSRLDSIEENYNFSNLQVNDLLKACFDRMKGIAINKNIVMRINYFQDQSLSIFADEEKIGRAITNIISNCIRHAAQTVDIDLNYSNANYLQIRIYDDGDGFEVEEIPYIFDRFFKGEKGNLGLGLAISKSVIEKHKGKITAENTLNGALFVIQLPV
ncbi:MAG: two-component sensor histidine kinase [Firmicutes bacterium HGW-Firmicutes-7]|nr:MAG: two-component sensor histidine kinase [Firmicutes bacterium HGW-Firmicutes-7]